MSRTLTALAAVAAIAMPASAQGFYVDGGYQFINIDEDGVEADLGTVVGHAGYNLNEWFAFEGEGAIGVKDETITVLGDIGVDVGLNYLVGAYVRGQLPVSERASLFARIGVVNAELEVSGGGFSENESDTGAGYGAGGELLFTDNFGLRGEYTRYDIEDLEADAFTIAAVWKF